MKLSLLERAERLEKIAQDESDRRDFRSTSTYYNLSSFLYNLAGREEQALVCAAKSAQNADWEWPY